MRCSNRPRAARAGEGLFFGVLVGGLAGLIVGGVTRISLGKDDPLPKYLALGVFGASVIASPIMSAAEPTC